MFQYTNDPVADFNAYDAEQQRLLDKLPKCDCCDEPVQDEYFYEINGDIICEECLNRNFRKSVDDYVA